MIVDYHEHQLEKAVEELSQSKALAGELAKRFHEMTQEIDTRRQQLRELDEKRRAMDAFLQKVLNVFKREEILVEQKKLAAEQLELKNQINEISNTRREIRIQGGETREEMARRELLRDEKQRQLREIQQMRDAMDHLIQHQFAKLAFDALLILLALIALPFLWKVSAFYVLAPVAQNSNPIRLAAHVPEKTKIRSTSSHPAQRLSLKEGEVLLTRVDYLQGSMGEFDKSTKWLMDWSYPFSSLAAGLCILTKIQHKGEGEGDVTLSTQENATEELAVIEIPEGESLVFRPHFLVALAHEVGKPPRIRTRWVFRRLHAWVNLQFRYMILEGPSRLVFSAQRGIQVENVSERALGRRVNSRLSVAFSPHLDYSPRRAETFVAYLWGKNALFDDFFQGSGIVIQQQVVGGRRNVVARFWEWIFGAIGKVFGI
jgi:uncharacterized protein (AIM24 family)